MTFSSIFFSYHMNYIGVVSEVMERSNSSDV